MLRRTAGAGAQVRSALTATAEAGVEGLAADGRPRAVVVAALAGSAMVAELLRSLAGPSSPVPVETRHSAALPAWVGPLDLVVAVSLSGNAPEPLAVAAEAARRGCRLLTVGLPGSPLSAVTERGRGIHVAVGRPIGVPDVPGARARSSRSSLWSLATPVLRAADVLGLAEVPVAALEAAADRLDDVAERCRPASEVFVNPAKSLAVDLAGSIPLVLGDGELTGVAAFRCAAQLARNARHAAMWGTLPDAASSIVATFDGPFARAADDVFADPDLDGPTGARLRLLLLRDAPDAAPAEQARLADAVRDTAVESGVRVSEVVAEGNTAVERVAGLVGITDFASIYLALGHRLDPATSPHVADLKERKRA